MMELFTLLTHAIAAIVAIAVYQGTYIAIRSMKPKKKRNPEYSTISVQIHTTLKQDIQEAVEETNARISIRNKKGIDPRPEKEITMSDFIRIAVIEKVYRCIYLDLGTDDGSYESELFMSEFDDARNIYRNLLKDAKHRYTHGTAIYSGKDMAIIRQKA